MPELVKCADCGFLAARHATTRELMDAESDLRIKGEIPTSPNSRMTYDEWPICFIRRLDFRKELDDNSGTPHRKRVLNQERECEGGFTPWQQGFTPKEHLEMQLLEKQAEAERNWRTAQAERERDWRREDNRERERDRQLAAKTAKSTLIWSIITLAVSSVVAIIAGAISGPVVEWVFRK